MSTESVNTPRAYFGVMVSSTFTDLKKHRQALIRAIDGQELKAIVMENDSAKPAVDVIDSSLRMVRDSAGYIGIISHKYGQIPKCPIRNPDELSLTELEFNESRRLGRPTLIFIMGDEHEVKPADVEKGATKRRKLNAFRENAKRIRESSSVHRVYKVFNSLHEFEVAAAQSVAELRRHLDQAASATAPSSKSTVSVSSTESIKHDPIPTPPAFYAEPPYIGSHSFVGRASQLETLNDWASPADPHPMLLFEAIGGSGKSMLTWEWITKHASGFRTDWAGQCWYSFYEKGATMVDFCRRTLAYMTGAPRAKFRERNTAELTEPLLHQLRHRPWLLVLDGLERVLVSYHRFDAAQLLDEQAGLADNISDRDPCAAINPEDEDLLRALSAAGPSKLLLTSRLVPRALLNRSGQPIPGALHERLPGLRPADAEQLIRSCGVTGASQDIQSFLKTHCDCHPLVIGVLAGLITDYLPDKGNFDTWVSDASGGGGLNLATLDLSQKRNHILSRALAALPEKGRQFLSILALLSESVDYATLAALNPSLPSVPEAIECPKDPRKGSKWKKMSSPEQTEALDVYESALRRHATFEEAVSIREKEMRAAAPELAAVVKDLDRRGLIQYDHKSKRYDLHPVVRGIAAGGLKHEEKTNYGQRVVDYFSQMPHDPYEEAATLEDFDNARLIVRSLFQMGRKREARDFIHNNNFILHLNTRFEAHNEILSIVRPFFSEDWTDAPLVFDQKGGLSLASIAAVALRRVRAFKEAFSVSEVAVRKSINAQNWFPLCSQLLNLASTAGEQSRLALEDRLIQLALKASQLHLFKKATNISILLARFRQLSKLGRFNEALLLWNEINASELPPNTASIAYHHYALYLFFSGGLTEEVLALAEVKNDSVSAIGTRNLAGLRGFWYLESKSYEQAKQHLQKAVMLANKAGKIDRRSEIRLAIARAKLGELADATQAAEHFSLTVEGYCFGSLADLWWAIGNQDEAHRYAEAAYRWAWADGAPYTWWHEVEKTRALLDEIGSNVPPLPAYIPNEHAILAVEKDAAAAIAALRKVEAEAPLEASSSQGRNNVPRRNPKA